MVQAIERVWTGSGTGSAPAATNLTAGMIGADSDGAVTGIIYYVANGAWISTTRTVLQYFGGA